jgi:hypothetical protein
MRFKVTDRGLRVVDAGARIATLRWLALFLYGGVMGGPCEVFLLEFLQNIDGAVDGTTQGILVLVVAQLQDVAALQPEQECGRLRGPVLANVRVPAWEGALSIMHAASIPRIIVQHRHQTGGGLGGRSRADGHVAGGARDAWDEGVGGGDIAAT